MIQKFKFVILVSLLVFIGCGEKEKKEVINDSSSEIKITQNAIKEQKTLSKKSNDGGQFYYSYNKKEKNKSEDLDKSYTKLDAYRRIRSPYEKVQISLLVSKLSKDFLIHCSACHDDYANGIIGPSLLDKSGDFIYKKLIAFKTKKEKNVLMYELVKQINNNSLKKISDEIAIFNKKVKKILQR